MAPISISRTISQLADQDPDRPAISHEGDTISRRQLDLHTNRLARAYQNLGVKPDDNVTIALPNSIEFYESCIAIWKLGATPQPVSAGLPQMEREAIIELVDSSLVVGVEPGSLGGRISLAPGFKPDSRLSDAMLPDRTPINVKAMTSGGSTGRPKLIVTPFPGVFDPEEEYIKAFLMLPEKAQLVPGPLYHNGPFVFSMTGLFLGNHIVVMTRFNAEETLELIERYHVDWIMMVPTMMHRIWRLAEETRDRYDLSSLRILFHMAAPCPEWLKEAWINWLGPERIHELYGGTESSGSTWITGEEWLAHRGSVGKAMSGYRFKIVGGNGETLEAGQVGEIFMLPESGQGSTYHYIGANADTIEGGWESLGDMGWMDEAGYLYLTDRKTDMIVSGGANIYPAEVEAAIDAHPAVRSSVVIGLPDDDMGKTVHAIVDAPTEITELVLIKHLSDRLVRYKIPRSFEFVSEPLRDDAGKIRRPMLIEARAQVQ